MSKRRQLAIPDDEYVGRRFLGEGICVACGTWQQCDGGERGAECSECGEATLWELESAVYLGKVRVVPVG